MISSYKWNLLSEQSIDPWIWSSLYLYFTLYLYLYFRHQAAYVQ